MIYRRQETEKHNGVSIRAAKVHKRNHPQYEKYGKLTNVGLMEGYSWQTGTVMNIIENRFGDVTRQVRARTGASALSGGEMQVWMNVGSLPELPRAGCVSAVVALFPRANAVHPGAI